MAASGEGTSAASEEEILVVSEEPEEDFATAALMQVALGASGTGALTISGPATRTGGGAKRITPRNREDFPVTDGVNAADWTLVGLVIRQGHLELSWTGSSECQVTRDSAMLQALEGPEWERHAWKAPWEVPLR